MLDNKQFSHLKIYCSFLLLFALFPAVAFFIVIGYFIFNSIASNNQKVLEAFFFFIPFYGVTVFNGISLQAVGVLIILLFNIKYLRIKDSFAFFMLINIIIALLSLFLIGYGKVELFKYCLFGIFVMSLRALKHQSSRHLMAMFVLGSISAIVYGFLMGRYIESWYGTELGGRLIGGVSDPNYFARLNLLAIASIFMLIDVKKKPILVLVGVLPLAMGIFYSGSKMGLFLLLAVLLAHVLRLLKSRSYFAHTAILAVIITGSFALSQDLRDQVVNSVPAIKRLTMTKASASGLTTGRSDLWEYAFDVYGKQDFTALILGVGYKTSSTITKDIDGTTKANVLHNIPLESLVELGILGLLGVGLIYFAILKNITSENMVFILVFFITSLFLSGFFYYDLLFFYIFFDRRNLNKLTNELTS